MSYNSELQNNNEALEGILAEVNALPEGGNSGATPYAVRLTEDNVTGNMYDETGAVFDTLSDEDKEYLFYGCGTGISPAFVVAFTGENRADFFECKENYDGLLAALRNGRTAYIVTDGNTDVFGCVPVNAMVTGFYLTRLGLVAMTQWHWVWFPNGSYHNADTDPYRDTFT